VLLDRVLHDLGTAPDFEWAEYGFALDSAADCAVHGHIEVKSSHDPNSHDDVEVFLFTSDDYANRKSRSRARVNPMFHTGPQTATTLNTGVQALFGHHEKDRRG